MEITVAHSKYDNTLKLKKMFSNLAVAIKIEIRKKHFEEVD